MYMFSYTHVCTYIHFPVGQNVGRGGLLPYGGKISQKSTRYRIEYTTTTELTFENEIPARQKPVWCCQRRLLSHCCCCQVASASHSLFSWGSRPVKLWSHEYSAVALCNCDVTGVMYVIRIYSYIYILLLLLRS